MSSAAVEFVNEKAGRLAALRDLLAKKFPAPELKRGAVLATGLSSIDAVEGGVRKGVVTELVGSCGAAGLFVEAMLAVTQRERGFAALIDAGESFDAQGCEPAALRRLLLVRCADAKRAVKAADFLLRDGNLPLVMLDLQFVPLRELGRIPASTWHRFQRLVEQTAGAFVVLAPRPIVESAKARIAVRNRWPLAAMRERRCSLLAQLDAQVFARRDFSALPEIRTA